jgi:hypothetical protein
MKNLFTICLVFCCCMLAQVRAQNDSTGCQAQLSYIASANPDGTMTFTALYAGVQNPYIQWATAAGDTGSGATFTDSVTSGTEICVSLAGMNSYYDSLQQTVVYSDSCFVNYCAVFYADTIPAGGCNAQASFGYNANPSGPSTFISSYSGFYNPQFQWFVNGNYAGNTSGITVPVINGDEVCLRVTSADSIQQTPAADSCVVQYCEVFYQDSLPADTCTSTVFLTYTTDASGITTFNANYSGATYASFQWFVNGVYVSNSPYNYTIALLDSTLICVRATAMNVPADSLEQTPEPANCFAESCIVYQASSQNTCQASVAFTYDTDSSDLTTFIATYSGVDNPHFQWFVN